MTKKPDITPIVAGYQANTALNQNFVNLRNAFDNVLSLDGSTPNAMGADLDMNGNDILNAGSIYVNGTDIFSIFNRVTVSTESPTGGSDGDIWFKVSV